MEISERLHNWKFRQSDGDKETNLHRNEFYGEFRAGLGIFYGTVEAP